MVTLSLHDFGMIVVRGDVRPARDFLAGDGGFAAKSLSVMPSTARAVPVFLDRFGLSDAFNFPM